MIYLINKLFTILLLPILLTNTLYSQNLSSGQKNGKLMIVGGGGAELVFERFMEEAGGMDANLVVIPTASGRADLDEAEVQQNIIESFHKMGAKNVTLLHSYNPEVANNKEFSKSLLTADAVWFSGGRQWRLMDAYAGTNTLKEMWNVLNRGGIIGGTSAGATIQGSYLARGDTQSNLIMMGDHEKGFGFLSNTAIDQHVLARNRQFDMFEILAVHPELLGIGLDEKTALLIIGDTAEVVGPSYVLMYDGSLWQRDVGDPFPQKEDQKQFYFLKEGNKYHLGNRAPIQVEND